MTLVILMGILCTRLSPEDKVPRKELARAPGVWERVPGSGVWWICYRLSPLYTEFWKVGARYGALPSPPRLLVTGNLGKT